MRGDIAGEEDALLPELIAPDAVCPEPTGGFR